MLMYDEFVFGMFSLRQLCFRLQKIDLHVGTSQQSPLSTLCGSILMKLLISFSECFGYYVLMRYICNKCQAVWQEGYNCFITYFAVSLLCNYLLYNKFYVTRNANANYLLQNKFYVTQNVHSVPVCLNNFQDCKSYPLINLKSN